MTIPKIKRSAKDLIKEEAAAISAVKKLNLTRLIEEILQEEKDPCEVLGHTNKHVTFINQISIILQITADQKKHLFTGDASIESFKAIPDYQQVLANLYWLKVPHHGSRNTARPICSPSRNPLTPTSPAARNTSIPKSRAASKPKVQKFDPPRKPAMTCCSLTNKLAVKEAVSPEGASFAGFSFNAGAGTGRAA
ncbi:hypothetical protein [Mucilaginibacter glaciei]|uniref:Uncharacterized protein n=1 Tax=Mucilaginibacter glaciei TaxID=2772109 RepID=A0A926NV43_9SPHI|nr:hypothetical protein [Mucilaginibacter glaciei]MBD1395137.1 hypothetical protein [Mucilaginibacter glaciei]